MKESLDPQNFKKSRYERPQQDWLCGRALEGRACPLGPDKFGHCRATGECLPAKKGDRWLCTRAEAQGGKCPDGPLPDGQCCHPIPPCQPGRSLRAQRGRLAWLITALTLGVLLVALATPRLRKTWTNPGPLTTAHATSATQCSDCHTLEGASGVAISPVSFTQNREIADSQRCLNCHALGPQPLNPHGASTAALATIGHAIETAKPRPSAPLLLKISTALSGGGQAPRACATCHQEHHGRTFDLKRLSDSQCQVCHSVQFASFDRGHPEFNNYPYTRRTRIFFDHASHLEKHFVDEKAKAPTSCQDCHTSDPSGRLMLVKGFDQTCAACHEAQIAGEGMTTKGIAFFTVPGIDTETLAEKGDRIGTWPQLADGKLTPFMQMLLSGDPAVKAALQTLGGMDLTDLRQASPAQLKAAAQLAWGVKGLLFDLDFNGQGGLVKQFDSEMKIANPEVAANLAGGISRAAVIAAQQDWFPALLSEVPNHRKGIEPRAAKPAGPPPTPAASTPPPAASGDASLLGGDDLVGSSKKAPAGDDSLVPAAGKSSPSSAKSDDLTSGTADLLSSPPPPPASAAPTTTPAPGEVALPEEDWTTAGGWYRPEGSFTLFYRPTGHADTFLTTWLDASAANSTAPQTAAVAEPVFQTLSDPQAPGLCMKCHTVDRAGGTLAVNWTAARPASHFHPFTKFNHSAHFSLLSDTGCATCHRLKADSGYSKYFIDSNGAPIQSPAHFESNFAPLSKAVCATCHTPRVAGDSCLECHSYHTGTFMAELKAPLSKATTAR